MILSKKDIENTRDAFNKNYNNIDVNDEDLQYKVYKKREFYYNKAKEGVEKKTEDEIKNYRTQICNKVSIDLQKHQVLLSNYINPETPYKGLLLFHETGVGKTGAAIGIAEKFKPLIAQYNTKIYILVPGSLLKNQWKNDLLNYTKNTYINKDELLMADRATKDKLIKKGINMALQHYKILSYTSFVKKTIGDKIRDTKHGKKVFKKTSTGKYIREITSDAIYSLNNTLIIVDEAHSITNNDRGEALKQIIKRSSNLKILLLTATPMKNLADDIVELLNFFKPENKKMEKKQIFNYLSSINLTLKDDGIEYLKKAANGLVSYAGGLDPLTYAQRKDEGVIHPDLEFTKLTLSKMLDFQQEAYKNMNISDNFYRNSESLANFVFPLLSSDKTKLIGVYGKDGMISVLNQLKYDTTTLNKKIADKILKIKYEKNNLIYMSSDKTITGDIYKLENLKHFSIKFYNALNNISKLFDGKKGAKLAFVYSNYVKIGIKLFEEILKQNGYLEYEENESKYNISPTTICYFCGNQFSNHDNANHEFRPATYLVVIGQSKEEGTEVIHEKNQEIIQNVFNNKENINGKFIKLILGSKVMNEGVTLSNIYEVHILDVHFNLGRIDQVIGRAIRFCRHYDIMNTMELYPSVSIYKYAIVSENNYSEEIELYKKAEQKYIIIKQIEKALKEVAFDCPLNYNMNKKKFKNKSDIDFFKCNNSKLNELYDDNKMIYKDLHKNDLDYSTFNNNLISQEINDVKTLIKEMYIFKYFYTFEEIQNYVLKYIEEDKKNVFEDLFINKALRELMPISSNDVLNFKDFIYDRFNNKGYLIYTKDNFIFQPINEEKYVSFYYRIGIYNHFKSKINLSDFVNYKYKNFNGIHNVDNKEYTYDLNYYNSRQENKYIGIIDSIYNNKNKERQELFKIRNRKNRSNNKKRGVDIQSFKGAVCINSKKKEYLMLILKFLKIKNNITNKHSICNIIRDKLLFLEKYSTGADKKTYIIIPNNHDIYPFPYNLEDRFISVIQNLKNNKIPFQTSKNKNKIDKLTYITEYIIKINDHKSVRTDILDKLHFKKIKNIYTLHIV